MEEGRLTDSFGRHVDFRNTILIMTSNIGADKITHQATFGFEKRDENVSYEKMRNVLKQELEHHFRPEFLNRVDEVVVFHKLNHADLTRIVELEIKKVAKRLVEHGLALNLSTEAKEFLLEKGTDEKFGARPLRRAIEQHLEDPLSENLLRGKYKGKKEIHVSLVESEGEKKLSFEPAAGQPEPEPELAGAGAGQSDAT
jgi:ATP-dependent Clp protease ATP-binding subunit ClpC